MIINEVQVDPVFAHDDERLPELEPVQATSHTGQYQCPRADSLQITTWHLREGGREEREGGKEAGKRGREEREGGKEAGKRGREEREGGREAGREKEVRNKLFLEERTNGKSLPVKSLGCLGRWQ